MRALRCHQFGPIDDLTVEELPDPEPAPGHVLVDVHAAGLNFPDALCVQGLYQFKPEAPFTPGQEGAGTVRAVGEGVSHPKVGDKVAFVGLTGSIADIAHIPANTAMPLPADADLDIAAAFTMAYGTSHYALTRRARLRDGETLLVLGAAGGVGLAAVEIGKALGARVIAAGSTQDKVETAKAHGADEGLVYPTGELDRDQQKTLSQNIKALAPDGVDVVYDPVGGAYAEPALRAMAWDGRYLVVGFASGTIPSIPLNLTLLKGCQIMGVFWGAWVMSNPKEYAADMVTLQGMLKSGALHPRISERIPLNRAAEGLRALSERKAIGKLIVTMS